MKLLVIESSPGQSDSLSAGLRGLGYRVDAVDETRESVKTAANGAYDTVIIDFVLPREPSLLILHEVRERYPAARIVVLSPSDDVQDRVISLIQGADEILIKPFDLAGLHDVLQDVPSSEFYGRTLSKPSS